MRSINISVLIIRDSSFSVDNLKITSIHNIFLFRICMIAPSLYFYSEKASVITVTVSLIVPHILFNTEI